MLPNDLFDLRRADVDAMYLGNTLIARLLVIRKVGRGRASPLRGRPH